MERNENVRISREYDSSFSKSENENLTKVYKKRWIMLALFVLTSMLNSMHWIQYSIIANITMKYFRVSSLAVNWSSMIFLVVFIVLVFPATVVLEKKGLKFCLIVGIVLMCFGSWLKLLALNRDLFSVALVAQGIFGAAQVFVISIPPFLAVQWFAASEVSTACAIGVFGNQFGMGIGFVIPPQIVRQTDDMATVQIQFLLLYILYAVPLIVLLVFVIFVFESKPQIPPSRSQLNREVPDNVLSCYKTLAHNRDYIFLLVIYGINIGVFYAYSTLINQLYLLHDPEGEIIAGYVGLVMISGGIIGTFFWGVFLDKTHLFKITTVIVYSCAFLGMIGFTFSLYYEVVATIFVSSFFLGFFMNGFLTVAYEFSTELTYPVPEGISSGLLNAVGETSGVIMILTFGLVLEHYEDFVMNLCMGAILLIGLVFSFFISGKILKRYDVNRN